MEKHAPGPWTWDKAQRELTAGKLVIIGLEDDGGCGDPECCGGRYEWIQVRSDADAHLIAAAPELLTALKAMVASYDGLRDVLTSGIVMEKLAAADAAIAKAEGR